MRFIVILLSILFYSNSAYAEVCDKVRPNWNGGAINQLDEMYFILTTPIGYILVSLIIIAMVVRKFGYHYLLVY